MYYFFQHTYLVIVYRIKYFQMAELNAIPMTQAPKPAVTARKVNSLTGTDVWMRRQREGNSWGRA